MASTDAHPITDLDLAASHGRMCGVFAQRAHDVRRWGPIIAHRMGLGQKMPPADQSEADMLAEYDRLAVVVERIRAHRAASVQQVAA